MSTPLTDSLFSSPSQVHRAIVSYSSTTTGEIRVIIPSVTGLDTEVPVSYYGREAHPFALDWVVPNVGANIIVAREDEDYVTVIWMNTTYNPVRADIGEANPTKYGFGPGLTGFELMAITPSSAGLYLSSTHMGYWTSAGSGAWRTYMDIDGNFYLTGSGSATHGLTWTSSTNTLAITGNITIGNVSEVLGDLGDPEANDPNQDNPTNYTFGAGMDMSLVNLPNTPTTAGLFLGANYLGYHSGTGGAWTTYMDSTGKFYLGGTSGQLQWNGSTLLIDGSAAISGTVTVGGTAASTVASGAAYGASAVQDGDGSLNLTLTDGAVGGWEITTGMLTGGSGSYKIELDQANRRISAGGGRAVMRADSTGRVVIGIDASAGNAPTYNNSGGDVVMERTSGGTARFSCGNKLTWNGSALSISGDVTATSGSFTGEVYASSGSFAGSLSAATGTFAGSLSAATGTFTGDITGASGVFAGSLSASNITAGSMSAAYITTGVMNAARINGGTITGASVNVTGSGESLVVGGSGAGRVTFNQTALVSSAIRFGSSSDDDAYGSLVYGSYSYGGFSFNGVGLYNNAKSAYILLNNTGSTNPYVYMKSNSNAVLNFSGASSANSDFKIEDGYLTCQKSILAGSTSYSAYGLSTFGWTAAIYGKTYMDDNLQVMGTIISEGSIMPYATAYQLGSPPTGPYYGSDLGSSSKYWDDVYARGGVTTSDVSLKENITDASLGLAFIQGLRPVSFTWKEGATGRTGARNHHGFIAQEVEALLGGSAESMALWIDGAYEEEEVWTVEDQNSGEAPEDRTKTVIPAGATQGLRYPEFIAPIVKAIQELSDTIDGIDARLASLEAL